jgi:long-chain acyl-CoA synthetase
VARKVLGLFGGRIRYAVCGGAPLSPSLAQSFIGFGLPLLQGYGMTETSPVVCCNTVDDNRPETVGRALQGVDVRIASDGELQVRGPSVMAGYWKRSEDTQRVMTEDGWLKTGDQARLEEDRVRIVGRIKEIIVTSTGEKIAPADLELAITADPFFEQAFVVGENRPYIAALVVLNQELRNAIDAQQGEGRASRNKALQDEALKRVRSSAAAFPSYAVPKAVRIMLEPWTIQNGLMTPTLKLKRNALMERFHNEIETIYSQRAKP